MDEREPIHAIAAFFNAIVAGQLDEVTAMYRRSATTYVFVEGPRWSTLGYDQIAAGWRAYLESPIRITGWQWGEGPVVEVWNDGAIVAGLLDLDVRIGGKPRALRFRASFVLRRDGSGRWRMIHEHLSQPMTDPYGIGDWLTP
jgi:ketosteroid isomerase-like protein